MKDNNLEKIVFKFFDEEINEHITESVWALKIGQYYKIDNIPFYAYHYSAEDIVETINENNELKVNKLIEASGNSTIRILFDEISELARIKDELNLMGCDSEISKNSKLLALNIPKKVSYVKIKEYLDYLEKNDDLQYEESCISEHHQKG